MPYPLRTVPDIPGSASLETVDTGIVGIYSNTGEADMLEAAIIHHLEYSGLNFENNYNCRMSLGYTRYACEDEAHREHYVYLAVKPLPPQTVEERVAAASAQSVAQLEASFAELQISDDVD